MAIGQLSPCVPCSPSLVSCRCHKRARHVCHLSCLAAATSMHALVSCRCHNHARHDCHLSCLAAATSVVVQKDTPAVKLEVRFQNLHPLASACNCPGALISGSCLQECNWHACFFGLYQKQNYFTKNKNYCNASGDELLLVDYFLFLNGYIHEIMLI